MAANKNPQNKQNLQQNKKRQIVEAENNRGVKQWIETGILQDLPKTLTKLHSQTANLTQMVLSQKYH